MKTFFFTTLLLSCSFLLFGQNAQLPDYEYADLEQFNFGNHYYQNNLHGISSLMNDLKPLDAELHSTMEPKLQEFFKRNRDANKIILAGFGGAIGLISVGVASQFSNGDFSPNEGPIITFISLGALVGISSCAIYYKKRVNNNDILGFINQFNQNAKADKIKFNVRPEVSFGKNASAGFSLSLVF